MKYIFAYIILFVALVQSAFSLRISEIMYNPTIADDTTLEWVELYNDSDTQLVMTNWTINTRLFSATLAPYESLVIARRLTATGGADSFEKYYGNNSGVWGDDPSESFQALQAAISLANTGTVAISVRDTANNEITAISYTSSEGGNGNDKTLELYTDGVKKESRTTMGTPGIQSYRVVLNFNDTDTKTISVHKNNTVWHAQFEHASASHVLYSQTPGAYTLRVTGSGYMPYETEIPVVNDDIICSVTRTPIPRYSVSGTIECDSDDKTATVRLVHNNTEICFATASANGSYTLPSVEAGTYTLFAEKPNYYAYSQEITVVSDMIHLIVLVPHPSFNVSFTVTDDTGIGVDAAEIVIGNIDTGMTVYSGVTSGTRSLTLFAGNYSFSAHRDGHFPSEISFSLPASSTEITLPLVRTSMIVINEIEFIGSCEYIEIFNRSGIPVTLQGASIADNIKSVSIPDCTITDYCVLTPNAADLTTLYGNDIHCISVPGFPVLNNDTDSVKLILNETILEEVTYTASQLNGLQTSLDRLRSDRALQPSNLYPSTIRTPGTRNSTYGLHNDAVLLELTEVAPFGSREYIEVVVRDDGNNGNGALLADFSFTDLDNDTGITGIVKTGDIILCESLSLADDADQAFILRNGLTYAGIGWRKKTVAPSAEETDDFNNPLFATLPLIWYETSDTTMSFQPNGNGTWELRPATPGTLQQPDTMQVIVPEVIQKNDHVLCIEHRGNAVCTAEIKIFDIAGILRESANTMFQGNGLWRISHTLETGRFIYMLTLKQGNNSYHKKGTFIAR